MKKNRVARVALVVAAAQLAIANPVWAGTCASAVEKAAIDTRLLQNELMVRALTCGANAQYNSFVEKFSPDLVADGKMLRGYFARAYGRGGESELNGFITRIANGAATRRMQQDMDNYCASALNLFNAVLSVDSTGLRTYAGQTPFAQESGVESCPLQAAREPSE